MTSQAEQSKASDEPPLSVWQGVYDSFEAASAAADIFAGSTWLTRAKARLTDELASLDSESGLPLLATVSEHPLPLIAAMRLETRRSVKVLDFGGGLAVSFLRLLASLPERSGIEYHVVELPSVVDLARRRLEHFHGLHFHTSIPAGIGNLDIVCATSSLHYVKDWRACLAQLAGLGAEWLLLADLPAGPIPTFVTRQIYYGQSMPVWFWNLGEFLAAVSACGYRLTYKAGYRARILGREGPLPAGALPPEYRLERCCDLLFHRNAESTS